MKYIAHRGLLQGPDPELENCPEQIKLALDLGYDCEIDLWSQGGLLFLGHDKPTYHVTYSFVIQHGLWIHAKNFEALNWLADRTKGVHYFWHEKDQYTLTSTGYIWSYPNTELSNRTIQLMPEWADPELNNIDQTCYGVCSDYVELIKSKI